MAGMSQAAGAEAWSLDSCVNYALDHNLNIKAAEVNQLQSELSVTEAKDAFLPNLSAGAGQNWDFGRGLTSANTYANRNTSMFSWNAQMSLPIFQGLRNIRQLKYSKSNLSMSELQTEASRDEVRLSVITSYLQVLFNKEMLEVSREQLRLSNVQLDRQRILLEGGKVPEVDVIQAESQVAQNEVQVVNSENDLQTSLIELAKALELDDIDGFDVQPIDDEAMALLNAEEVYNNALANYPAIRAARQGVKVADDAMTLAKSGYLPGSVSAQGSAAATIPCQARMESRSVPRCATTFRKASDSRCRCLSSTHSQRAIRSVRPRQGSYQHRFRWLSRKASFTAPSVWPISRLSGQRRSMRQERLLSMLRKLHSMQ